MTSITKVPLGMLISDNNAPFFKSSAVSVTSLNELSIVSGNSTPKLASSASAGKSNFNHRATLDIVMPCTMSDNNVMKNTTQVVDDVTKLKGPFLKLATANMVSHDVSDCLRRLQEKYSPALKVVTSGNIWIDFIVPGYNKGTALQTFLDLFGVKPEECIAFGDQYNDIEMLELAGQGYAMSAAAPGIAAHAEYVTDSVEEVLEDVLAGLDQAN